MAHNYPGFEISPELRRLLVDGKQVQIGARAFDLLLALADREDRVVSKHELLDIVWPQLVVEENNLQVQIHALRKLLGADIITTVPGRGYRFTATEVQGKESATSPGPPLEPREHHPGDGNDSSSPVGVKVRTGNLPECIAPIYGRHTSVDAVRAMLDSERLVTISGAGGIGKTRLGLAVAHEMRGQYDDGVWLVELASIADPETVAPAVAQALGVQLSGRREAMLELSAALRPLNMLLLLDNCEHVLEAVSRLAVHLLASAPNVQMLATSQEVLRVSDEKVYKIAPLAVPSDGNGSDPRTFGAVELFVQRVQALDRHFDLDARNVGVVVEICRRLDGIPLAIELAAARVPGIGVFALKERLDQRFRMLTGGSRVALRRHQTLRAALDWSHNLLSPNECKVFRRLAVFSDGFSVDGAQKVCCDDQMDAWATLDILSALVDKSLVMVDTSPSPRYRYLESTRAYAMEKLAEAGETAAWLRRHAESIRSICEMAARRRETEVLWAEMNNVRVAYAWAVGADGDSTVAVALATVSAMVLAVSGLVNEALQRLLEVEPLVDASLPRDLAARYWQWLGRGGIEGRLPTSRCLAALYRAETIFREMGNQRHVHACLRMRAEAMVASEDVAGAMNVLMQAESMETRGWPAVDRLRRLRVQAMADAAAGLHQQSLLRFETALHAAQSQSIHRYELILLADIGRLQLDRGDFDGAAAQFGLLAERAIGHPSQGLTLAQATAGLVAARLGRGELQQAAAAARDSIVLLRRSGIFVSYCDVHAWLLAALGQYADAALILGCADEFHRTNETTRDSVKRLARREAMNKLANSLSAERLEEILQEGARGDEDTVAAVLERALQSDLIVTKHPSPA